MLEYAYLIGAFMLGWVIEFSRLDDPSLSHIPRTRWIFIAVLAALWPVNWLFIGARWAYRQARFVFTGHD